MDNEERSNILLVTKVLSSVGSISAQLVSLELSMMEAISKLTSTELNIILRLVGGDSFTILLKKLMRIIRYKFDNATIKDFKILYKSLDEIRKNRNKYIHSIVYVDKKKNIFRFKIDADSGESIMDSIPDSLPNMEKLVEDIKSAKEKLELFVNKVTSKPQ